MTNWKAILLALPFTMACLDEGLEEDKDAAGSEDSSGDDSSGDDSSGGGSTTDPIEAAAVGFELVAGWDQAAGALVGWTLDDGTTQEPYVVITLASLEYFNGGYDASQTCELYANFVVDETAELLQAEIFNWDTGVGSSGTAVAPWENASFEGYLEVIGVSTETNCDNFDTTMYPLGGFLETFNLMHFGIAFAELGSSTHVRDIISEAYDEDGNGSLSETEEAEFLQYSPAYMTQYIAMNHPNASAEGGYDFIGYDWNYGIGYEMDTSTGDISTQPCEDDPETECLIPTNFNDNAGANQAWIRSGSFWLEDFPNFDLEGLQLGNGISE